MKRRLDLAMTLIARPQLIFLDEPTTGLDPRSRNQVWEIIRVLVAAGTTVLLTTQHLDEADQLAHRIAIIDHGKVIAEGTPGELKASIGAGAVHVRVGDPDQREEAQRVLERALETDVHLDADPAGLSASAADPSRVAAALTALTDAGVAVTEFALGQPSLDEVFLALTGHPAEEPTTEEEDAA
jgi:ABC-2 type transport system ATP-binding protein